MTDSFRHIKTERLFLRKLAEKDWKEISFLRSDPVVNRFVKRPKAETKEKALEFIDKINAGIERGEWYYWGITKNGYRDSIGTICLWNFSEDRKAAEVGFDLNPDYQGQGIMDEALKKVIDFGFRELNLEKMDAFTHRENMPSIKLLKRNGFEVIEDRKDESDYNNIILERIKNN